MRSLPFLGIAVIAVVALQPGPRTATPLDGLQSVFPSESAKSVAQTRVGADLDPGWSGELSINDQVIPEAQLDLDSGLNQVAFSPGPGKVIEHLRPNQNCAEIEFWRTLEGRGANNPSRRWCFDVV